jgi:hypothetical protein
MIMKILNSLLTGTKDALKMWKAVLIIWSVSLLLVSLIALPVRSAFYAGLGNSTISEKLKDGINIEVLSDMGAAFRSLKSFLSGGILMLILVSYVLNAFFTGGLFGMPSLKSQKFLSNEFFSFSVKRFWSFFWINLIFGLCILGLLIILIIIPIALITSANSSEVTTVNYAIILSVLFILLLVVFLISADYARIWQSSHEDAVFKAFSNGFRDTFRYFGSSYPLMLTIFIFQVLYVLLTYEIVQVIMPGSSLGILLLFLISQILVSGRILIRTIRYRSMIALSEINRA